MIAFLWAVYFIGIVGVAAYCLFTNGDELTTAEIFYGAFLWPFSLLDIVFILIAMLSEWTGL